MSHEIRMDDDGVLDEFVANGANVHLERMTGRAWHLSVEVDGKWVSFWFSTRKKRPVPYFEVSDI